MFFERSDWWNIFYNLILAMGGIVGLLSGKGAAFLTAGTFFIAMTALSSIFSNYTPKPYDYGIPNGQILKIVGNVSYLMQSDYAFYPKHKGSGYVDAFHIIAFFPDLAPLNPTNRHLADKPGGHLETFGILISDEMFSASNSFGNLGCVIGQATKIINTVYHCIASISAADVYLVLSSEYGYPKAVVTCSKMRPPFPTCDLTFEKAGNRIQVRYAKSMVLEAERVMGEVDGLLQGFIDHANALGPIDLPRNSRIPGSR
jgi:hypothetical protein